MKVVFNKYHGSGNDFILIDNRNGWIDPLEDSVIKNLCDRKFGIGADGLILLTDHPDMDFEMSYFNADGLEGSMCGNGARCITAFAQKLGLAGNPTRFQACDGPHEAITEDAGIRVTMSDVTGIKLQNDHYFLNTGSPHAVFFREDVETMDVYEEGRKIRYQRQYGEAGTNVNFIRKLGKGLYVRTYERGVENETLSCGTGVVAAAICSAIGGKNDMISVNVHTRGGNLQVRFRKISDREFREVWLKGPVRFVFEGQITL